MLELTNFLRWLIEYAVVGGFWHFAAVFLIVRAITAISTLARITIKSQPKKEKAND